MFRVLVGSVPSAEGVMNPNRFTRTAGGVFFSARIPVDRMPVPVYGWAFDEGVMQSTTE
jgi:hypothetical protein